MRYPDINDGHVPGQVLGAEWAGSKALFISDYENALTLNKMLAPGYGLLRAGTVLALNNSGGAIPSGNAGMCIPYVKTLSSDASDSAKAYVVADIANTSKDIYVTLPDSYRFVVGDELIVMYNNSGTPAYFDGGAITAIDRTTSPIRAKITVTNAADNANMTIANFAGVYVKSGVTTKFCKAVYILDQDVDTGRVIETQLPGTLSVAKGGFSSVLVSNALLRYPAMINLDAAAITDLGCIVDGMVVVVK